MKSENFASGFLHYIKNITTKLAIQAEVSRKICALKSL